MDWWFFNQGISRKWILVMKGSLLALYIPKLVILKWQNGGNTHFR